MRLLPVQLWTPTARSDAGLDNVAHGAQEKLYIRHARRAPHVAHTYLCAVEDGCADRISVPATVESRNSPGFWLPRKKNDQVFYLNWEKKCFVIRKEECLML